MRQSFRRAAKKEQAVPQRKIVYKRRGKKNKDVENYRTYHMSAWEYAYYFGKAALLLGLLSWLFYRSVLGMILLSPFMYLYIKEAKRELIKNRQWQLGMEFKEALQLLSASLCAGYSMENACREAKKDLTELYGRDSMIAREFGRIAGGLDMHVNVEELFYDFAKRSGVEDIQSFYEVFTTAKRSGGDMIFIMKSTVQAIAEKMEVKREISTAVSAKRMEQNLMNVIPIGIMLYMTWTSPDFFQVLYHNAAGILIMTVCLLVYGGAWLLGKKLLEVEV